MDREAEHRDQPVVTVVDPAAPTRPAELLAGGPADSPPWRPSRGQLRAGALLLVLTVLTGTAVLWWQRAERADRERALDQRAAAAVRVSASLSQEVGDLGELMPLLEVSNDGPDRVQVVAFDLDRVTTRPSIGTDLEPGTALAQGVDLPACGDPERAFQQLRVLVRTVRGTEVVRDVPLAAVDRQLLRDAYRARCRYAPAPEALFAQVDSVRAEGRTWVVRYQLGNVSSLPVRVLSLSGPGLDVTVRGLPLALGPATELGTTTLEVRMRARDCAALRPLLSGDSPSGLVLRAVVDGLDGPASAGWPVDTFDDYAAAVYGDGHQHFREVCDLPPPAAG